MEIPVYIYCMRDYIRRQLSRCTVGIAGAGGLGSNCAVSLARLGIGRLVLADFDVVSLPNLDRQAYFLDQVGLPKVQALSANIFRIDPAVKVEAHTLRLDPESVLQIFSGCAVIVEAFDDAHAKAMIIETVLAKLPETWLVAASGIAGFGKLADMGIVRSGKLFLVGDRYSEVSRNCPPLAPRVSIAAGMEADLVVQILLGKIDVVHADAAHAVAAHDDAVHADGGNT